MTKLNLLALLCFLSSLLAFSLRSEEYVKPLSYYILTSLAVGFLFISILKTTNKIFPLLLICAIGLSAIWTENWMFPHSLIGLDPWQHLKTTTQTLSSTSVDWTTIGGSYSLMHLYLRWIMDISGMDYKWASLIFVGSLQILGNIVLIYFIGKLLINSKVGLIASLMVSIANWGIFWGEWVIPNGIGVTLSLGAVYCVIRIYKFKKYWLVLPVMVILAIGYLTHFYDALWVTGSLMAIAVIPLILDFRNKFYKLNIAKSVGIVAILSLVLFAWMSFTTNGNAVMATASYYDNNPLPLKSLNLPNQLNNIPELIINSSGMVLFMGIALIGCLLMLKRYYLNKAWVILAVGVLAIGIIPSWFGIFIIEHRWWYFAEILLAIPLAVILIRMANKSLVLIVGLVAIIAFLSVMGLPSNMTNRTLSANQIVRYAFTDKELEGLLIAESYHPEIIGSDPAYSAYIASNPGYQGGENTISVDKYLLSGDFKECPADVLLLRESLAKEPFGWGSGAIYRLNYKPIELAQTEGYQEVWDNGEIACLVRRN